MAPGDIARFEFGALQVVLGKKESASHPLSADRRSASSFLLLFRYILLYAMPGELLSISSHVCYLSVVAVFFAGWYGLV